MNLRLLTTEEMTGLTATWIAAGSRGRAALIRVPALAALLPELEAAHAGLVALGREPLTDSQMDEIREQRRQLQDRHDRHLRGIWYALLSEIHFARSREQGDQLRRLRNTLLPRGLSAHRSHQHRRREQVAALIAALSDDDRALLDRIKMLDKGSLLDAVDEWLELVTEIADLEAECRREQCHDEIMHCHLVSARQRWIEVISSARAIVRSMAGTTREVRDLLTTVAAAERAAERRQFDRTAARGNTASGTGVAAGGPLWLDNGPESSFGTTAGRRSPEAPSILYEGWEAGEQNYFTFSLRLT